MLRVSIITPVKAKIPIDLLWLEEAIESVIAQTSLKSCEMVIVDDHSTIDLSPIKAKYDRIRWLDAEHSGVSPARNQAVRAARAELILPLDANDKLAPTTIESFLDAWDRGGSDQGIVYCDAILFGQDFQKHYVAPGYSFDKLLYATIMTVGSLHRKSDHLRVGGWRADLQGGLEDWEYWIALGEIGVCGFHVPEPLYWYRQHESGRLAHIKSDPQRWAEAKARVRDLHQDVYNGRYPMGCCGGGKASGRVMPSRPQQLVVAADRDLLVYTGNRSGSFGFSGPATGAKYIVPGKGEAVETEDGKVGVDPRDTQGVMAMQVFKKAAKPKPKVPVVARDAKLPVNAKPFNPDLGAVKRVGPGKVVKPATPSTPSTLSTPSTPSSPPPNPSDYSIKALKSLDLTTDVAYVMLSMEREGKNRKGAIAFLESVIEA